MRMYMEQNKEIPSKTVNELNSDKDKRDKNFEEDCEDDHKRPEFFIYAEEAHEPKIYVSEESEDTLKIKTNLIRYNIKEIEPPDG